MKKLILCFALLAPIFAYAGQDFSGVPIEVLGGGEDSFQPAPVGAAPVDVQKAQVVIVGAGLAGLSSAVYLTDHGVRVLVLEKEDHLGGLAASGRDGAHPYDRGAAYWTLPYEEEKAILDHIGIRNVEKNYRIHDPIDSYFVRGKYYNDIWEAETLKELPASFALFKFEIERANDEGKIPDQPLEEAYKYGAKMDLDALSTKDWIEQMPQTLRSHLNVKGAKDILARYEFELSAGRLRGSTGMQDVLELMELYCRSALGSTPDQISAMAFANFYISEIVPRYTTPYGTNAAANNMIAILKKRRNAVMLTGASVDKIRAGDQGVEVTYEQGGQVHLARAPYAVFSAQLKEAPKLIESFTEVAPLQAKTIQSLRYADYSVHAIFVDGHPYRSAYDTWVYPENYSPMDFTDVILGRWMDPAIHGFTGMRDLSAPTPDQDGIFTIYHPLPASFVNNGYTVDQAKQLALDSATRLESLLSAMPSDRYNGPLKIKRIETSRWPYSVHIPEPGHFVLRAPILRRPFLNRVFFANNNLGTPAFEEALFRGHCAADNVLLRMNPKFKLEKWTRCPVDAN